MDTADFLTTLFGDKPDDLYVLLWTYPDKRSTWHTDLAGAVRYSQGQVNLGRDVYVGVGLSPQDMGPARRCPKNQIAGIVGLWADLDFQSPAHKKANLPPDGDAALGFLSELGLAPTIVVHSGHGLQAWWLFREVWVFDSESERRGAEELAKAWNATARVKARQHGWDVDSTWDLARVLRLPGTVNFARKPHLKEGELPPSKVVVLQFNDELRYNPSDFDEYLLDAEAAYPTVMPVTVDAGALTLRGDAWPPGPKLDALLSNVNKFKATWEYGRKDLQDQSPSGYDMALANYAVQAGWSDQEIVDLLLACRARNGQELHLDRPDKYALCIKKARESRERNLVDEEAKAIVSSSLAELAPEDRRQAYLEAMSALLGIHFKRVVRYTSEPQEYYLETEGGQVYIGSSTSLMSQSQMRAVIFDATNTTLRKLKPFQWDDVCSRWGSVTEDESAGEQATRTGALKAQLQDYLSENRPYTDVQRALSLRRPYIENGAIHVFLQDFMRWVAIAYLAKMTSKDAGIQMRRLGATDITKAMQLASGKATTRKVWRLPPEVITPLTLVVVDGKNADQMQMADADDEAQEG